VGDAIQGSIQNAKVVPAGAIIQGDGFSVRVPQADLYVVKDSPRPGFLSLRSPESEFLPGSYNVYPFTLATSEPTLKAAWQAHISKETSRKFVQDYRVLSERTNEWRGSIAWFHIGYFPSSIVTANCVTRHGDKYYLIVRSISLLSDDPHDVSRQSSMAEQELEVFLDGIQFNVPTTNNAEIR